MPECVSEYVSVAQFILRVVEQYASVKVHRCYLPDVLALVCTGKIAIVDDSSNPVVVRRAETSCL
jgi:hypothetical protein